MPRRLFKNRKKKELYNATLINADKLFYRRAVLDMFAQQGCNELIMHKIHILCRDTPFNRIIKSHVNALVDDIILSPDDLTSDAMRQTYLRAVPRDILNCIMQYLFRPYKWVYDRYTHTGVTYYGVQTGIAKKMYSDGTHENVIHVNGHCTSTSIYCGNIMLEKKIYEKNRLTHVYRRFSDVEYSALIDIRYASEYPFILTMYYPDGRQTITKFAKGKPSEPPLTYMRGKLITE